MSKWHTVRCAECVLYHEGNVANEYPTGKISQINAKKIDFIRKWEIQQ